MLKNEIMSLISLKQEGSYWDFKREWYSQDKKAELLHDIICMANNLSNRNAYIIIGVDEEKDYSFASVKEDKNRKSTQQLVDFLRDKHFAGEIRPIVNVESIIFDDEIIDVIVIHNSDKTPFYLVEKYQSVNANNIYTRVMDSNTPKNRSANIHDVEILWKKRFGLLESPLNRMMIYLKDSSLWDVSPLDGVGEKLYYRFSPEFTIESVINESKNGYQFYLFSQTDIHPRWYDINLYYHQTMLASIEGVFLDGGRYFTPSPSTDGISLVSSIHWDITFKYYIKQSIEYVVHKFYYQSDSNVSEESIAHDRFMECVLVFETDSEIKAFKEYVKRNWESAKLTYEDIWLPYFEDIKGLKTEVFKEEYLNSQILKKMQKDFYRIYQNKETNVEETED